MQLQSFSAATRASPFTPKVQLRPAGLQGRVASCPSVSAASFCGRGRFVAFSQPRDASRLLKSDRSTWGGVHTAGGEGGTSMRSVVPLDFCRFYTAPSFLRRESRRKWLEAAQEVARGNCVETYGQAAKPQVFIVNGEEILLSTSPAIPGHSILQFKGLAEGSSVRGRSALEFWRQQLQQQLGGEQQLLHDLLRETRQSALQRLAEAAVAAGGNAVVSVRLVTSGLQRMHAEYTAYGTAVRVSKPAQQGNPIPH
ncbi:hypothetical protein Esti_000087 [Eimeria stiedai]